MAVGKPVVSYSQDKKRPVWMRRAKDLLPSLSSVPSSQCVLLTHVTAASDLTVREARGKMMVLLPSITVRL